MGGFKSLSLTEQIFLGLVLVPFNLTSDETSRPALSEISYVVAGPQNQLIFLLSVLPGFIPPNGGIETAASGQLPPDEGHSLHDAPPP